MLEESQTGVEAAKTVGHQPPQLLCLLQVLVQPCLADQLAQNLISDAFVSQPLEHMQQVTPRTSTQQIYNNKIYINSKTKKTHVTLT